MAERPVPPSPFAFGLVILEALTGLPVASPTPGHRSLLGLLEEDLEEPTQLVQRLVAFPGLLPHPAHCQVQLCHLGFQ